MNKRFKIHLRPNANFIILPGVGKQQSTGTKPRLVRQQAVQEESSDIASSPPRLGVRFLPTIPSAADSSVILDDDSHNEAAGSPFYTVLQSGNTLTTLSSPTKCSKSKNTKPP